MDFARLITEYLSYNPEDALALHRVHREIGQSADAAMRARTHYPGHFTAAAFVVTSDAHRLLLLEHKALCKWLQPGGHIEPEDMTPVDAAYRELAEETGITREAVKQVCLAPDHPSVPFDVDIHTIPANTHKQEPEHYHYDMRYLFTVPTEVPVVLDADESNGFMWVDLAELSADPAFTVAAKKIRYLLSD